MRRNLDLAGPLLLAEGVGAAVAPLLEEQDGRTGKEQLQAVVDRTLQAPAAEQAATYRKLLREAVPPACLPTSGWKNSSIPPATWARPRRSPAASWPPTRNLRPNSTHLLT